MYNVICIHLYTQHTHTSIYLSVCLSDFLWSPMLYITIVLRKTNLSCSISRPCSICHCIPTFLSLHLYRFHSPYNFHFESTAFNCVAEICSKYFNEERGKQIRAWHKIKEGGKKCSNAIELHPTLQQWAHSQMKKIIG